MHAIICLLSTRCCRLSALLILVLASSSAFAADAARPVFPVATKWTVEIPAPPVAGAPPVGDDRHVYVALRTGQIIARRNGDGEEAWRRDLATEHPLAVDSGFVFVVGGDALHALRAADGVTAWESPLAAPSAPLLAHGGWVIAISDGSLRAFRAADGTLVWQRAIGPSSVPPFIDGDRLYASADDGRVLAMALTTGAPVWEQHLGPHPSAPFSWGDRVYVGGGDRHFYCLKAKDGEIDWSWRVGAGVDTRAAADDARVYFVGLDNVLRALDRITGVQQWQQGLKRRPAAGPVVMQRWVLIPSSSSAEIWAWTAQGRPAGTVSTPAEPAVAPRFVSTDAEGARIYVITGGLARVWQLTLVATAGDPPVVRLIELPGTLEMMPGEPVTVELPRL